jgi:PKD repeat protein/phage pi2 protein 07
MAQEKILFMKKNLLLLIAISLLIVKNSISQTPTDKEYREYPYWTEMMTDTAVNFYEIQKAFNLYYEDKDMSQEKAWKQYKRWEWNVKRHINEDGSRQPADKIYKEYQKYQKTHGLLSKSAGDWSNLGPTIHAQGASGVGRINAIAFHPSDEEILYVGAPAGGLWRTVNGGEVWENLTDQLPTLGVSAIVVDYSDPSVIYIGSGDRDAGDAQGMGVFKSIDNGLNWELINNGMGNKIVGRLIQDKDAPNTLLAATNGGIFKTIDGGETWELKKNGNFKELVYKPNSNTVIYATKAGQLYKTTDAGETWDNITGSMMSGSRSVVAVTPQNPNIVYFLLTGSNEFNALYKSTNSGNSFSLQSTGPNIMGWACTGGSGGQAWYDLDIVAAPNMQSVIYAGGVNCFKSINGGQTWDISSHWYGGCDVPAVHADLHVLEYNPLNNRIYAGNDGGIFYTADGGNNWYSISNNLSIQQLYRIGSSKTQKNKVMVGAQDNGSAVYMGTYWKKVIGGDGMDCLTDHTDPSYAYGELYFGSIFRMQNNGYSYQIAGEGINGMTEKGAWITPYCLNEFDHNIMYAGVINVWRTDQVTSSATWSKITTGNSSYIDQIEASSADANVLYYSSGKKLYRSDNVLAGTPSWIPLSSYVPTSSDILSIETSPLNPDVVWISQASEIYRSEDRGVNWEEISGSLPDVNINSIVYYPYGSKGLYVGTDMGVYYKDSYMEDWLAFSGGLPVDASVNEVEYFHDPDNPTQDVVRAGTYGRGLWESPVWCEMPTADFEADFTTSSPGCFVNFTDLSTGNPANWSWTFEGGEPTTSNEQNPSGILYAAAGIYEVTLTVTNNEGQNTKSVAGYITIDDSLLPEVSFSVSAQINCPGEWIELYDESLFCPVSWNWSFDPPNVNFENGTSAASQNPIVSLNETGSYSVTLSVTNANGTNSHSEIDFLHSGGIELPYSEDFENAQSASNQWTILNPDGTITWDIISAPREDENNQAMYMNLYAYYTLLGEMTG